MPSVLLASLPALPLNPPATQIDPFHATFAAIVVMMLCEAAVHVIPSEEYASVFVEVPPPATQIDPFHATEIHPKENMLFPFAELIQVIPSYEYASLFVPLAPATQIDPFQATE